MVYKAESKSFRAWALEICGIPNTLFALRILLVSMILSFVRRYIDAMYASPISLQVRNADKTVVIQEGKITEEGSHDELMLKKGPYYHLVHAQVRMEYGAFPHTAFCVCRFFFTRMGSGKKHTLGVPSVESLCLFLSSI